MSGPAETSASPDAGPGRRLLIDGMNVIGTRRTAGGAIVTAPCGGCSRGSNTWSPPKGEPVALVLDGKPLPDLPEGRHDGVEVFYAQRGGPNAADDRIVKLVNAQPDAFCVITSDRTLRERVEELGSPVEGASSLWRRLDRLPEADASD